MAEEVDDMEYSFYAPNLLYKLIKDREDKLGLAKKVSKKKDKDLKEEEVDDPVKEKWLKIKTVKKTGLLGPTEEKYKNQYIKLYKDKKLKKEADRGATFIPKLRLLKKVIENKHTDLWNIIKKEKKPITLTYDNLDFKITINNLDDFNKLINSPLKHLRVVDREYRDMKKDNLKEIKQLNKLLEEKVEEIDKIKKDLTKYDNKYKHYIEHPEDIVERLDKIKVEMSETANNEEINRLEEEERVLNGILNLHRDLKENIKQKEKIEKESKEIIDTKNKEIEEKREMVAHANKKRHESEVEKKHLRDELAEKIEQSKQTYEPSKTQPTLKDYIKDKVINKSYSLEKDELMNVIEKDINEHKLSKDIDVSKLADTIYLQGAKYINKHMKKIKSLVKITGYDNDLYNKLPPELAGEIQKYIHDKALEDIRKKNIRYILPKEMPRWEKAVNKGINPMLGRGAWSK